ncbi:MarR family winged helix-turn-helix transcriptional regulator [Aestuariirhabdus litorea]|uniref:MarR family transcriptional regulator n=1 Tax=Aestuariirhabdus litorea TaxID=2528527 RepID=A0A3P3VPV3_9GAMM|nr:MarR family transcriptional regulator [Aestuariirhabdus litorea]RRJ84474.1 MarR family transcriptional regulator [Aestuariirhabdus litorea]RWW97698.1 MarR family transcriptional regulator [Endozoicomonadaceae bacterium GTF-13]
MSAADQLKLDNQLCFALYAGSRAITRLYRPLLEPLGLTYPQYLVLLVLWERRPQAINVKELGEKLSLDSGTLTPLLKRMEQSTLIVRKRSKQDERAREISLTAKGTALRVQASCIPARLMQSAGVSAEQVAEVRGVLRALLAQVEAGE